MRPRTLIASTLAAVTLAVLVPSLATAVPIAAADVVVSVNLGANDPVAGASVVARDAATGTVTSSVATTGRYGYAVIRMFPGESDARVIITSTGGRSDAFPLVPGADIAGFGSSDSLRATVTRGDATSALDVIVNPATTVGAAYIARRPDTSAEDANAAVAQALRLPQGEDIGDTARYSRGRFSGELFARAARRHGGIAAYAAWQARRIASGASVPSLSQRDVNGELPLRSPQMAAHEKASGAHEHSGGLAVFEMIAGPLLEKGMEIAYCQMGLTFMCEAHEPAYTELSPEVKKQLGEIEAGISDLKTQMASTQSSLAGIDVAVAELGTQIAGTQYTAEANAVDDVMRRTQVLAGLRAQGEQPTSAQVKLLENALSKLYELNSGCPYTAALVGGLPTTVLAGVSQQYPAAGCLGTASGDGIRLGLMQFAQRQVAQRLGAVASGARQTTVDSGGEYWLNEFVRDTFASSQAAMYAARTGRGSRSAEDVDSTRNMFSDAVDTMYNDGTGAYFGARIPTTQVLQVSGTQGTVYGIGTYAMPGECRGSAIGNARYSLSNYTFNQDFGTSPAPVCTDFQTPPPSAPGAPDASAWSPLAAWPAGVLKSVKAPLRNAAMCQVVEQGRWRALATNAPDPTCPTFPEPIPATLKNNYALPNLQVSTQPGKCKPWRIGTYGSGAFDNWPTGRMGMSHFVEFPAKAVGMECPVTDLTPGATVDDGWNCVSASPDGTVMVGRGGSFAARGVTSSSPYLNTRTMGGYCPSWGGEAGSPARSNTDYMVGSDVKVCSKGFVNASKGQCVSSTEAASWPLAKQITNLTSYSCSMSCIDWNAVPGYKAENWTYNNHVAGDYVVGPLYTSNAVGSYVPGTKPGGPAPGNGTRFPKSVPGRAEDVTACGMSCTEKNGSVRVTWHPPASTGGRAITKYTAQVSWTVSRNLSGTAVRFETHYSQPCVVKGTQLGCTIDGVPAGNTQVQVTATNRLGDGLASTVGFIEEYDSEFSPGRPLLRTMYVEQSMEVVWTAPPKLPPLLDQARIVSYVATASPGGAKCTALDPLSSGQNGVLKGQADHRLGCFISGLRPGTTYTVTVVGEIVHIYRYGGYEMQEFTPASLASLPLKFELRAPGSAQIPTSPGAPGTPLLTAFPGRIDVAWAAPQSDGGAAITGYTATALPGGATCTTTTATKCTIANLENGTAYTVTVTATNSIGTGLASGNSVAATPSAAIIPLESDSGALGSGVTLVPQSVDAPAAAPTPGDASPSITGFNLMPRTLVPGIGSNIAYTLSEPAAVTLTFTFDRGRTAGSRVVFRIAAGRAGATAGSSRLRLLYSRASARTKRAGTWKVRIEARTAHGAVSAKTLSIKVKTAA